MQRFAWIWVVTLVQIVFFSVEIAAVLYKFDKPEIDTLSNLTSADQMYSKGFIKVASKQDEGEFCFVFRCYGHFVNAHLCCPGYYCTPHIPLFGGFCLADPNYRPGQSTTTERSNTTATTTESSLLEASKDLNATLDDQEQIQAANNIVNHVDSMNQYGNNINTAQMYSQYLAYGHQALASFSQSQGLPKKESNLMTKTKTHDSTQLNTPLAKSANVSTV